MKQSIMCLLMAYLFTACAVGDGSSDGTTRAIGQRVTHVDDELCSRWTACYIGCATMPCDDAASCAAQQAAYTACDTANAPAPDYCPMPL